MNIEEYHKVLLRMMTDFAQMCDKAGLKYFLGGGTCLGAIRHKGFIPWDDDIDLGMPRSDYEKLGEVFSEYMPSNYELIVRESGQIYQVLDKNVPIEMPSDNFTAGAGNGYFAFLDIFPMDGAPSNEREKKKLCKRIMKMRRSFKLGYVQYSYTGDHHSRMENLAIRAAKWLHLERFFKKRAPKYIAEWHRLAKSYSYEESEWVISAYGTCTPQFVLPKEVFGEGIVLPFEDKQFCVPSGYDTYLKALYGEDYMVPKKRSVTHLKDNVVDADEN